MPTLPESHRTTPLKDAEAAFRRAHPRYADTAILDELRHSDFARLDAAGHVYLDYTGAGLYADSQLDEHLELLRQNVFGNPHSLNPTSAAMTALVEHARTTVLDFFRASPDGYVALFTPNATGALRLPQLRRRLVARPPRVAAPRARTQEGPPPRHRLTA